MNKLNEVKKYLKNNSKMYVGWCYSSDPADYPVYETKEECMRGRKEFFKENEWNFKNYSKEQIERMYEVRSFVFARKFDLEENVPVCPVDEFKFN